MGSEARVWGVGFRSSPSPPHCLFWSQILLPLINQYFTNHCLYFLSTPAKVLGSGGHASNKEKEMITRWAALSPWPTALHLSWACEQEAEARVWVLSAGPLEVIGGLGDCGLSMPRTEAFPHKGDSQEHSVPAPQFLP